MDDCITISDDEEVQLIKYVINLEPNIVDLTDSSRRSTKGNKTSPESKPRTPEPQTPPKATQGFPEQEDPPQPHSPLRTQTPPEQRHPSDNQTPPDQQPPPERQPPSDTPHSPDLQLPSDPQPPPDLQTSLNSQNVRPSQPSLSPKFHPEPRTPPAPPPPPVKQISDHELMVAQKDLGNEKYRKNQFDEAIRVYKNANQLARKLNDKEMSAILHFNMAMTYFRLGSYDQAADECANAVKINDNYFKAHLKRAEIYQRQRKFEEAVIVYEHICELDSSNQDYAILLNHAKEAAKQTRKKDYHQMLGLDPKFTREDLKRAYRKSALTHHPDRHSDADIVTRRIQEKRFKEASEAHTYFQLRHGRYN